MDRNKLRIGVIQNLVHETLLGRDWEGVEQLTETGGDDQSGRVGRS